MKDSTNQSRKTTSSPSFLTDPEAESARILETFITLTSPLLLLLLPVVAIYIIIIITYPFDGDDDQVVIPPSIVFTPTDTH